MRDNKEQGYRVVYGEKLRGVCFLSEAETAPEAALENHAPLRFRQGIAVIYSKTLEGARRQAKMCKFLL